MTAHRGAGRTVPGDGISNGDGFGNGDGNGDGEGIGNGGGIGNGMAIRRLSAGGFGAAVTGLADLLVDVVGGGSSLGFLAGLDRENAAEWWHGLAPAVAAGRLAVWAAYDATDRSPDRALDGVPGERASGGGPVRCLGTVGLAFTDKPNGRHRAEIVKLMVHPDARGRGLARALLAAAEDAAVRAGITLLVLDTETGSPAETVYERTGWTRAGVIPDYATDPAGVPRPTTLYYKRPGDHAPGRHERA